MERYTPSGLKQIISVLERKQKELKAQRIATARRKQDEHPRYAAMTAEEFHQYKRRAIRASLDESKRIDEEIERYYKMLERA